MHTVARVRESTYKPGAGANGWDHPVSWCRDYDGGRSFYTGMGGTADSYAETDFRDHLRGALAWTTRLSRADCKATINANYTAERVTQPNQPGQHDQIGEPHGLVTAPDGRVFYIGRGGADTEQARRHRLEQPRHRQGPGQDPRLRPEDQEGHARRRARPSSATRAAATSWSRSRRGCSASSWTRTS